MHVLNASFSLSIQHFTFNDHPQDYARSLAYLTSAFLLAAPVRLLHQMENQETGDSEKKWNYFSSPDEIFGFIL